MDVSGKSKLKGAAIHIVARQSQVMKLGRREIHQTDRGTVRATRRESVALHDQERRLFISAKATVLAISAVGLRVLSVGDDAGAPGYAKFIGMFVTLHNHGEGIARVVWRQAELRQCRPLINRRAPRLPAQEL